MESHATASTSTEGSLSVLQQPLKLLYQAAIEKLNEELAPALGPDAIQRAMDEGMDFTPEATAESIVSIATGFYDAFKANHADEDENAVLEKFMATIKGGIDKGFAEARGILDELKVLDGEIKENVDKTHSLVGEGLDRFESDKRQQLDEPEAE